MIAEIVTDAPRGWSFGLGHVMRGAVIRVPEIGSPLPRVTGKTTVHFDGGWSYASDGSAITRWVDNAIAAMRPFGATGDYINYLSADDETSVARAYGSNYQRLTTLKRRYDPDNVFRGNRNIRPA